MNARKKGNNYECKVVKDLIALGYTDALTSRNDSKRLDDLGVDVSSSMLPIYLQLKAVEGSINYGKLFENHYRNVKEGKLSDSKPFIILHKKNGKKYKVNEIVCFESYLLSTDTFHNFVIEREKKVYRSIHKVLSEDYKEGTVISRKLKEGYFNFMDYNFFKLYLELDSLSKPLINKYLT